MKAFTPHVLLAEAAHTPFRRGFERMADLLAVTLGPTGGNVLMLKELGGAPEVLSDAATIARRIIGVPYRAEDAGAMLMRHVAWKQDQRAGDGAATAAVIARDIAREGSRLQAAGAEVMALKRAIERAAAVAGQAIDAQARPVRGYKDLIRLALAMTGEQALSTVLGEMFHNLGAEAHIRVEQYVAPYIAREYLEGGRWVARVCSPHLYTDAPAQRAVAEDCMVVLFAGALQTVEDVQPVLELVAEMPVKEARKLFLCAHSITGEALSLLVANHRAGALVVVAAEMRRAGLQRDADFDDLACLTGGHVLRAELGDHPAHLRKQHVGMAARVEAGPDDTIVTGPAHFAEQVEARLRILQRQHKAVSHEPDAQEDVRQRMARLVGRVATLKVGAYSDTERDLLKTKAEKALRALPLAIEQGSLAGGGAAFVHAADAVLAAAPAGADEAAWGYRLVARALEAPLRQIARNAGARNVGPLLAETRRRGGDYGFEALSGRVVNLRRAGVLDSAGVLREALRSGVSGGLMALTVDALVLHANPQVSYEP